MKLLFVPVVAWCVCASCFGAPENAAVEEAVVEKKERGDGLDGLRKQVKGLAQSLEETGKLVREIARQRDEARENAERSEKGRRDLMKEVAALRGHLAAAEKEGTEWKNKAVGLEEKMKEGAMAHEELKKFRGELQGALKEFADLKGDIGKARSEIQDPVERAELKKQAGVLKKEQQQLGSEIEMALEAKEKGRAELVELGKELKAAKAKLKGVEKLEVERDQARTDLAALRIEMSVLAEKAAKTKLDFEAAEREWGRMKEKGSKVMDGLQGKLKEFEQQLKEAEGAKKAMAEKFGKVDRERADLSKRLAKAEADVKEMAKEASKPHEALKRMEEARRKAMSQVRDAKEEAAEVKKELATTRKAKEGVEALLFRKAEEVKKLQKRVKELEAQ